MRSSRFFRELSEQGGQQGCFSTEAKLQQAIAWYLEHLNNKPRPFIWTVGAPDTAQVVRARNALARWTISAEQNGALQHEADVTAACA